MSVQKKIQSITSYRDSCNTLEKSSQNRDEHYPDSIAGLAIDRKPSAPKKFPLKKLMLIALLIIPMGAYYLQSNYFQGASFQGSKIQGNKLQENKVQKNKLITPTKLVKNNTQIIANTSNTAIKVLDASGHIVARRIATVSSRITGKLNKLYIEEGQAVVKEQILAELDNEQALINYQLSLAELTASQANVEELNVALQYEQQRLTRRQALVRSKLISTQLADDSQLKTKQLSAQLLNRQALVSLAKQKVALANYQLDHHKIRAPFDGVVISKNAQVGELISTGSSAGGSIRTGVGTIVDMDSLEIEVEVGESYINRVYADQQVQATLDAYPNWTINSEVIAVIPTADKQKASIKVRIKLLEKDPRIFPDMSVKVSFLDLPKN